MHIVYLTSEYPLPNKHHGGVGTFVKTLGARLVEKGHQVTVVGKHNAPDEFFEDNGVEIHYFQQSNLKMISGMLNFVQLNKKLQEIYQKNPYHLVESPELGFAFIKKIPQVKYLIRLHGGHHFFAESENRKINWWKGLQEKLSFKKADHVVAVSNYAYQHTLKYINFKDKYVATVYYPINIANFELQQNKNATKNTIFFAGTLCEKKGIRQLVQALALVKKEIAEVQLIIAGRDWIFPHTKKSYKTYLQGFIDNSIKDSIVFLGSIPNHQIPIEIAKSEICCYPSHMETFGIVAIEAMAMSKPVVFTNRGPGTEIITNYKTGIAIDPLNIQELANAIVYMLKNKEEATQMGVNARKFVLENFDIHKIANQNIELYRQLIN